MFFVSVFSASDYVRLSILFLFRIFCERKKERKCKLKPESSASFETPVSDSVKEIQDNATNGQDFMEKVSRCFLDGGVCLNAINLFFTCLF